MEHFNKFKAHCWNDVIILNITCCYYIHNKNQFLRLKKKTLQYFPR